MRTVGELPHEVREDEYVQIPLSGGIRLAARIWGAGVALAPR